MNNTRLRTTRSFKDEIGACDDEIEQSVGDEAIIDGRFRVMGFLVEKEDIRVNLGKARAGMKINQTHFKIRPHCCRNIQCGMTLESCGTMYKIGEITPPVEGYQHLNLTTCGACA